MFEFDVLVYNLKASLSVVIELQQFLDSLKKQFNLSFKNEMILSRLLNVRNQYNLIVNPSVKLYGLVC